MLAPDAPLAKDQTTLAMAGEFAVLEAASDPVFDHWTTALRRNAGAAAAAFVVDDGSRRLVRSACTNSGATGRVIELPVDESFEDYLLGLALACGGTKARLLSAAAPVTVGEQLVGHVGMADHGRPAWTADDLEALHDIAIAMATELALRMATKEAERIQRLVTAHDKVHDMIARAVPLGDVLAEVCNAIEQSDPSLVPSVLQFECRCRLFAP